MYMGTERFVIFTGFWPGDIPKKALPDIGAEDFVACADGGYAICSAAGINPGVVIGDFDSLSEDFVAEIDKRGIERVVYPREKDETDTMRCVKYGLARGFCRFLIVGGIGGEFGHTMANVQILSFISDMGCVAEIITGAERVFIADGETERLNREVKPSIPAVFSGCSGAKFSVFSYAERSIGVFVLNAKYELSDVVLTHSYPLGVSNEFINKEPVTVSVRFGRLLIIAER
jgi:thiamine pyrophosphokinase